MIMDDGDDACDGDNIHSFIMSHNHSVPTSVVHVGYHHYCRVIPIRWQVRTSLERGTVPELSDPCDMCHHQYVSDCYVRDHGSMTVCFR